MDIDLLDQYIDLMLSYISDPREEYLFRVEMMGKELVDGGAAPEDLVEMHELALARLIEKQPDITLKEINKKMSVVLMELFMAYGVAYREQVQLRKIAMDELKISEEKFRSITDIAHDAIIMMNSIGQISYWNTAAERIFGYKGQEIIGKDLHRLIVPEQYHTAFYKGFREFEKSGEGAAIGNTLELAGIRKGGEEFPVELSLSSVKLNGQWNAIGVIRDISVRKHAEDKMKDSHREYQLLAEQFEESNKLKELLLDIITHDLKNPIGNILNATEILLEDVSGNELLDIIQDSSTTLLDVMENITVLAQVGIGDKIETMDLDLVKIIRKLFKEFASQLTQAQMKLELNLPTTMFIRANPIIAEIPKNYISNAIKYAGSGRRIIVEVKAADHKITLEVKDFGDAIPADKREHVFIRRVQLTQGERRGVGLGLAIVNRIAKAHNAVVGVRPNNPRGNVFFLEMPVAG